MQRSNSSGSAAGAAGSAGRQGSAVQDWWLKQAQAEPLFKNLLWSRPENKAQAGKLLIVGGNLHSFAAVAKAYAGAGSAGAGAIRVILPDATKKLLGSGLEAEFVPSTPSGSFAQTALAPILDQVAWADAVLLAGDFGRNSETAVLLDKFLDKYQGGLTLSGDALDYFLSGDNQLLERPNTSLVVALEQLQKLAAAQRPRPAIKLSASLQNLVEIFHQWQRPEIVTHHADQIVIASGGQISTTPAKAVDWPTLAAATAVWRLQNPAKPFEALTTAVFDFAKRT